MSNAAVLAIGECQDRSESVQALAATLLKHKPTKVQDVDVEFIFRFDPAASLAVQCLRRYLRELLGSDGTGPLSWDEYVGVNHLLREVVGTRRTFRTITRGDTLHAVPTLENFSEVGEPSLALRTLAYEYCFLPLGPVNAEHVDLDIFLNLIRFEDFVMCDGRPVPEICFGAYKLREVRRGKTLPPLVIPVPADMGSLPPKRPHSVRTRIRTWTIYYWTTRGGGSLSDDLAVDRWREAFGGRLDASDFRKDRTKLLTVSVKT